MSKMKNKTFSYKRHEPSLKDGDFHLEIEKISKQETPKPALTWPSHILVFGSTMAGKTTLISDIFDNIDLVYDFKQPYKKGKLIVISPIHTLEIADKMTSIKSWDVELYNNLEFNEDFEEHLIKCFRLAPQNTAKVLLLDDVLTQATNAKIIFLNKLFAYLRHEDVSIIATVHSYDIKFSTIIDQSGLIVAMYCLNTSSVMRSILTRYLYKGTAKVWKELRRIFYSKLHKHEYICLNFTEHLQTLQNTLDLSICKCPKFG